MKANPIPVTDRKILVPYAEKIDKAAFPFTVREDKNGKPVLDFGKIEHSDYETVAEVKAGMDAESIVVSINEASRVHARTAFIQSILDTLDIPKGVKAVVLGSAGMVKAYESAVATGQWNGSIEEFRALFGR